MQKYNKFRQLMLTYRYLMFKMREITHFKHKITYFIHFAHQKCMFFTNNLVYFEKKHYFCR